MRNLSLSKETSYYHIATSVQQNTGLECVTSSYVGENENYFKAVKDRGESNGFCLLHMRQQLVRLHDTICSLSAVAHIQLLYNALGRSRVAYLFVLCRKVYIMRVLLISQILYMDSAITASLTALISYEERPQTGEQTTTRGFLNAYRPPTCLLWRISYVCKGCPRLATDDYVPIIYPGPRTYSYLSYRYFLKLSQHYFLYRIKHVWFRSFRATLHRSFL